MDASCDAPDLRLEPGQSVELRIDGLAAGGDGVGRAPDGRVVFVPWTAPGDRVRVRIVSLRSRFARAELERVLEPGTARAEPACRAFGRCGGCSWQHVDYAAQCEAKRRIVEDALRRLGHVEPPRVDLEPSPQPYAYRARARVRVEGGRVGYRQRRSHALCAVDRCPVLAPPLEAALRRLAQAPPTAEGDWELAAGATGAGAHRLGDTGDPIELSVDGHPLRISPGVFLQAHAGLHAALVKAVADAAGSGALALELFAGAGFFTLRLARAFERLVAVEAKREAVDDLRHNLARSGQGDVEVVPERVEHALARGDLLPARPDAVVLDPPRTGLGRADAERLLALGPRRIAYLSCDPATLARDVAVLAAGGFAIREVRAFDLFPQTPHVEVLATLRAVAYGS